MISKIKVKVRAENANINLPAIPISWLPFFLRIASRVPTSSKKEVVDDNDFVYVNVNDECCESDNLGDKDFKNRRARFDRKSLSNSVDLDVSLFLTQIGQVIKEAKPLLRTMEPFTLVEVQSDDAYVLIEMR